MKSNVAWVSSRWALDPRLRAGLRRRTEAGSASVTALVTSDSAAARRAREAPADGFFSGSSAGSSWSAAHSRSRCGTRRTGVPAHTSTPYARTSTSSGTATQPVTPRASRSPESQPIHPPACIWSAWSCGRPLTRCRSPRTARVTSRLPTTMRGRVSGRGCERMSTTAASSSPTGSARAADPRTLRVPTAMASPTGPAASQPTPTAATRANAMSPSARPSLRCSGSNSRVRPTARATPPTPRASMRQVPRTVFPSAPPDDRFAGGFRPAEERLFAGDFDAGLDVLAVVFVPDFAVEEDFAFVERCGPRPALPRPRVVEPLAMTPTVAVTPHSSRAPHWPRARLIDVTPAPCPAPERA